MMYRCMHGVQAEGNGLLCEMLRGILYQQARMCGVGGSAGALAAAAASSAFTQAPPPPLEGRQRTSIVLQRRTTPTVEACFPAFAWRSDSRWQWRAAACTR
jgi:hypothetical protein